MLHRSRTRTRTAPLVLGLALLLGLAAPPAPATAAPTTPELVDVRAGSHPGFDRVVFEFDGGLPEVLAARYVDTLRADGSGKRVRIAGAAVLELVLSGANAHDEQTGEVTVPRRLVPALPNVVEVVRSGDFEATVSHGIGVAQRRAFTVSTLTAPSRVVVDIRAERDLAFHAVHLLDVADFAEGTEPYTEPRLRRVPAGAPAGALLHHLFAGPTLAEQAFGLATVRSGARGFRDLSIVDGVARLRLTGGCSSGGSTFTVADLIMPTLKQFATVDHVKIYDPEGRTARHTGSTDSIPECLEP